ncbi:MAG TPA: LacI family transcriptional regulator [Clostridiales bacterium]|jgi:LacI family transcriptional regulator|nr:LacI family transcriptional regulator [Clostridiales bacterium]
MAKNITMKDIAIKLGVSTVTVSKALSGKEGVSNEVRELIKHTAEEMGYRYNALGKSMREGRNYNIGILIAEQFMHESAFYSKMYQALIKEMMKFDYFGILEIISGHDERKLVMPHILKKNKVDGIILLGQMHRDYIRMIDNTNIPYIFLDFVDDTFNVDTIISDNVYGAYEITKYLISHGHSKIGFVGNQLATTSITDRYIGFYKALLENKLEIKEEWIINDRDEYGNFIDLRLPKELPTAFVCNCDKIAYELILLLKKKGIRVPNDVSVVGYDNYIYATLSDPQITTVEVNVEAMSEMAVASIIRRCINPAIESSRKIISGKIIVRNSVSNLIDKRQNAN